MLIYRVENSQGKGPYWGAAPMYLFENNRLHPAPQDDSKFMLNAFRKGFAGNIYLFATNQNIYFGFESIKQFKRWFFKNSVILDFHKYDFRIVVYKVSAKQVVLGNTQLAFVKENATVVGERPLTKYLDK